MQAKGSKRRDSSRYSTEDSTLKYIWQVRNDFANQRDILKHVLPKIFLPRISSLHADSEHSHFILILLFFDCALKLEQW